MFCSKNDLHNDPPPTDQYLFALNQLFIYQNMFNSSQNTFNSSLVHNINPYYTLCGTNVKNVSNYENYWGHYAGHLPQSSSTMHVYNPQYYSVCIDTNIHRQSNTSVTDVLTTPDVGNIVFMACKCQVPFEDCDVDISLNDSLPVLCTLDFIKSLDTGHTHQVVFFHDSRGLSSGFYYMYQESVDSICLYVCHDEELGPFQVIDSKLARVVFCNQGLAIDCNANFCHQIKCFTTITRTYGHMSIMVWIIPSI